jgi:hypothetical protein
VSMERTVLCHYSILHMWQKLMCPLKTRLHYTSFPVAHISPSLGPHDKLPCSLWIYSRNSLSLHTSILKLKIAQSSQKLVSTYKYTLCYNSKRLEREQSEPQKSQNLHDLFHFHTD